MAALLNAMEKCDHCDHPGFLVCLVSKYNASVIENRSRKINLNDFLISKIEMKINFYSLETIVVIVINNIYFF